MPNLIGTAPNQVPVNGLLGTAAFIDTEQLPVSGPQNEALGFKASTASPALTGVPTAPTAAVGTNTTQLATTAFVNAEIANGTASKADKDSTVLTPATSATPPANGDLVFERTSDTSLTLRLKGTDGVVRSVALTLA